MGIIHHQLIVGSKTIMTSEDQHLGLFQFDFSNTVLELIVLVEPEDNTAVVELPERLCEPPVQILNDGNRIHSIPPQMPS